MCFCEAQTSEEVLPAIVRTSWLSQGTDYRIKIGLLCSQFYVVVAILFTESEVLFYGQYWRKMHLVGYILIDTPHFAFWNLVVVPLVGDQSWEKLVKWLFYRVGHSFSWLKLMPLALCWRSFGLQIEFRVLVVIWKALNDPKSPFWSGHFCPLDSWPTLQLVVFNAGKYKKIIIIM